MVTHLLLVSQLHAASVAWYAEPVAVDLHPVHYSYWARYHELYTQRNTGAAGSPVFREPMAASAVYYQLWESTGEQPWLSQDTAERWRDMAISSASIAAEALVWETLDRSDELGGAVRFMRTFVSPNLELSRGVEGWKATANDPDNRLRPTLERRELHEGMLERPHRPQPSLSVGSGLDVEELDALTERERSVDVAVWLRLQQLGPDQLTLRGRALSQTWELSCRQHIVRGLSLAGATSSGDITPVPKDWGAGLSWSLPRHRWWTVVLRYHEDLARPEAGFPKEWSARLTLRWLPPIEAPVGPDRWPMGQRVGAPGPTRPSEPPGGAIATAPVHRSPATETEPEPEHPRGRDASGSSARRR